MRSLYRSAVLFALALPLAASCPAFADSSCDAVAGNLVTNCGFEDPTPFNGWTMNDSSGNTVVSGFESNSGANAALLGADGVDTNGNPVGGTLSQTISDIAGQKYQLSFYLQNENTGGVTYPGVDYFGASVTDASNTVNTLMPDQSIASFTPDQYSLYSFEFIGSGSDTISFDFYNAPSYYNLDDVTLNEPTPEPSSLALMGTGALFFAEVTRRRVRKA